MNKELEGARIMCEKTENVIKSFVKTFKKNPWDFLYESDIQGLLFSKIYSSLEEHTIKIPPEFPEVGGVHFNPVKTEYPYHSRFDIAILDSQLEKLKAHYAKLYPISPERYVAWGMPLQMGIEIKYCVPDYSVFQKYRDMLSNVYKLEKYRRDSELSEKFIGLAMLFILSESDAAELGHKETGLKPGPEELRPGIHAWIVTPREDEEIFEAEVSFPPHCS